MASPPLQPLFVRRPWLLGVLFSLSHAHLSAQPEWQFTNITLEAGFAYQHGYLDGALTEPRMISGGVAAGDYDRDGWIDLYVVRGDIGPNLLFRNLGDGTFEEVGAQAGVDLVQKGSGPSFIDIDGDGLLDLFIGGIEETKPRVFRNLGDGTFVEVTASTGLSAIGDTFSCAAGDYDRDGDLDLFLAHWTMNDPVDNHLWRNNGDGTFTPVDQTAGIDGFTLKDFSFTPNFADINGDQWPDLLIACDFNTSQVYLNQGDGTFHNVTDTKIISDENGMGAAIGDYDGDGDLDWFVSSIWDPNGHPESHWGITGNRLYRNLGNGSFEDVTSQTGVREGYWGWGSCFADLNNDGHLDLVHTNGFPAPLAVEFHRDPTRLFISNGMGFFNEQAEILDLSDTSQGRGIVCFDFDRDGDLDIFLAHNSDHPALFRNDGGNQRNYFNLELINPSLAAGATGARVYLTANGATQMREVQWGCNFVSQQPLELHFGLDDAPQIDLLEIRWPDGAVDSYHQLPVNQRMVLAPANRQVPVLEGYYLALFCILLLLAGLSAKTGRRQVLNGRK